MAVSLRRAVLLRCCAVVALLLYAAHVVSFLAATAPIGAAPPRGTLAAAAAAQPSRVDIVFTWVNGSDPRHAAAAATVDREARKGDKTARHRDLDELRYSLRGIQQFAPWVGHVYIIVFPGQRPCWLKQGADGVTLVPHDVLAREAARVSGFDVRMPMFNSNAIRALAAYVPGLSERFLVMDNDIIFANSLAVDDFFRADGGPVLMLDGATTPPELDPNLRYSPYSQALYHTNTMLNAHYGTNEVERHVLRHAPYATVKSSFLQMHREFHAQVQQTLEHPFRAPTDVDSQFLYSVYLQVTPPERLGHAVHTVSWTLSSMSWAKAFYISLRESSPAVSHFPRLSTQWQLLRARVIRPAIICVNDDLPSHPSPEALRMLPDFFEPLLPTKSRVETVCQ